MTVINGLPAHVLFVHFIVVLVPLTALLEVVCALWRAARRRLVSLVLVLAALTTVLTPITIFNAGKWLFSLRKQPSPILRGARWPRRMDDLLLRRAARRRDIAGGDARA